VKGGLAGEFHLTIKGTNENIPRGREKYTKADFIGGCGLLSHNPGKRALRSAKTEKSVNHQKKKVQNEKTAALKKMEGEEKRRAPTQSMSIRKSCDRGKADCKDYRRWGPCRARGWRKKKRREREEKVRRKPEGVGRKDVCQLLPRQERMKMSRKRSKPELERRKTEKAQKQRGHERREGKRSGY